jgi:hypothetical protein
MKQREVKGIIAVHVDGKDDLVEQLYRIALDSGEFETASDPPCPETAKRSGQSDPDDNNASPPASASRRAVTAAAEPDQEQQPALF